MFNEINKLNELKDNDRETIKTDNHIYDYLWTCNKN